MSAEYEKNVYERFVSASEAGRFTMSDELNILNYLVCKYKLKTISNFAKFIKKTYQSVVKRLKNEREMTVIIDGEIFIITNE